MKTRNGFVSNSSSSSFTCDVCGNTESGWDACLHDVCMNECSAGHVFCDDHRKECELTVEEKRAELILCSRESDKERIKNLPDNEVQEEWDDFEFDEGGDGRYWCMTQFCPVCCLDSLPDEDMLDYMLEHNSPRPTTREEVLAEIKKQFGTYQSFRDSFKTESV